MHMREYVDHVRVKQRRNQIGALDRVIAGAGRNRHVDTQARVQRHHGNKAQLLGHLLFSEVESGTRQIGPRAAARVVVNLHDDARMGRQFHRDALGERRRPGAGSPTAERDRAGQQIGEIDRRLRPAVAGVAGSIFRRIELFGLARRIKKQDDVMHRTPVARKNIGRLDPPSLVEIGRQHEATIHVFGSRRDKLFFHLDDEVRLAVHPLALGFDRRRHVGVVALFETAIDPKIDLDLLVRGEAEVAPKLAMPGNRLPGRHDACVDDALDVFRPILGRVVAIERERGDVALAMALLAFGLEDSRDVAGVIGLGNGQAGAERE